MQFSFRFQSAEELSYVWDTRTNGLWISKYVTCSHFLSTKKVVLTECTYTAAGRSKLCPLPGKDVTSWFQTIALLWMLYSFFWVIPRRLNFMCRRFGTLFYLHMSLKQPCLNDLWRWKCSETSAQNSDGGESPKRKNIARHNFIVAKEGGYVSNGWRQGRKEVKGTVQYERNHFPFPLIQVPLHRVNNPEP
jgi:hypothetical protein